MDIDDSGYSYNAQSTSSHNGHDNGPQLQGGVDSEMPPTSEYDGHSHHIQIPSYASSPVSSPQTPFSPRAMAIQQLKRAASVREQRGQNNSNNDNQLMATPSSNHSHSASGSSSGHGHSPTHSPSVGMSPSMSRAPSIKRIGLERSASDAARRLAMAKLTGEKITPPPEYTMPKTPLPAGPLPSLADLQARHEQRLGIASPEPVPSTSSHSPPQGLSRNPSSASTSLSRQLSAASARTGMSHNLSRNPSLARSLAGGAHSPMSGHDNDVTHDGLEDEEAKQRRTDERQEARSNLIRKLSRGRLAGAAAAANIRERNAAAAANAGMQTETADGQADATPASPGAPSGSGLQRRPSLAEMLARAESRNQQRSQMPETPSRGNSVKKQRSSPSPQQQQQSARDQANASPMNTPSTSHSYISHGLASSVGEGPFSLQSELRSPPTAMSSAAFSPPAPSVHAQGNNIASPATPASITPQASALRKAAALKQFEHIPIPPTPSTSASQSTPSNSQFSPNGSSSAHESIYSAMSNYRSYRHTMERDRDSAMARLAMEDNFELENAATLETGRASLASSALPTSSNDVAMGPVTRRARLHEHHPLSDEEGQEELEDDDQSVRSASRRRQYEDDPTLRQQDFTKDGLASQQAQTESMSSPPDKLSEVRSNRHNLPVQQQQQQHNAYLTATPPPNLRKTSDATSTSSLSARRSPGSMPQTPVSGSPRSPFAFSPADAQAETRNRPNAHKSTDAPFALDNNVQSGQDQPFLRHHQKEPNGDFPVSVVSSRSSHYPEYNTLPVGEHPPMPDLAAFPIDSRSVMKDHDAPNMSPATYGNEPPPPPLPEKTGTPSSSEKIRLADRDHATATRARTASPSPSPLLEHRVPYRSPEELDNAGPTSEYRFPTASSRGRRPDSISSSNEHHEDGLNSMISQLEAMQAAGPSESAPHLSPSPSLNRPFGQRGLDQAKKTLPRQILQQQQTFPQAGPGNPHVLAPKHAMPDYQSNPINGLPSQLRHPAPRANGSAQLSDMALPSPRQQKEASVPVQHGKRLASGNHPNQQARESGNEAFVFTSDAPAYHSSASAENDSAPSLARTGTGSSSSGFSANSDGGLAVTAAVLPPKQTKEQIMSRLSALLANYKNQPKKPTALEDPPRHLLLHSPVLQVVNSNTVKDRYLFLFDDILVIAKPLIEEDGNGEPLLPNLDTKFLVKSIVELPKLKLTAQTADTGEDPVQKRKHPLLLTFVDRFANDPRKAVGALVAKAGLSNDATTIANLLFRNPELNRSQLGAYLAHKDQKPILKAYCDRFRLAGIRIEDALRVFIGSLRLPNDYTAAEYMLSVFASQWLANNPGTGMTNDGVFATKLVLSMMELNDALHSGIDDEATAAGNLFSFPNSAITVDDFIAAFRLKDPHGALPDEHLTRIYLSIRKDRLQQAADNAIVSGVPEIEIVTHPSRLPNRLTYRTASENISLTIPKVDPKFAIKLVGQDLRFEPPVLTFARSRTATFRVTPTALGSKAMLFIRLGQNAHLYRNLPINKTFSVERAFMNHTFQIAFVNHLGVKRKYLFSLSNAETKYSWVDLLRTRIENSPVEQADTPRPSRLSDAVSLQVLRDALIAPDEPAPVLANKPPLHPGRPGFSTPPNSRGKSAVPGGSALQRSSSFSKTYAHGLGKAESDLAEQRRPSASNTSLLAPLSMRRGSRDDDRAVPQQQQLAHKTGHELVTAVCQNSLLPLVLGFVGAGVEGVDALPRKPVYLQGPQVHATPAQARGTGRFKDL